MSGMTPERMAAFSQLKTPQERMAFMAPEFEKIKGAFQQFGQGAKNFVQGVNTALPAISGGLQTIKPLTRMLSTDPFGTQGGQRAALDAADRAAPAGLLSQYQKPGQSTASAMASNYADGNGLSGLAQQQQKYLDGLQNRRSQLAGLQFQRQANPYARGTEFYTNTMNDALSRPSAGLQQALLNQQQSLAERGITADSGLAQQAGLQARNEAAKMAAMFGNQAALDLGQRGAAFDAAETEAQRRFDFEKARNLDEFDRGNLAALDQGFRTAADLNSMQYGRRLDRDLDPLTVQTAQQGVTRGGMLNTYQQALNDKAAFDMRMARDLYEPTLAAEKARLGYDAANYGALADETAFQQQMANNPYRRGMQILESDPIYGGVQSTIRGAQQSIMPILGMGAAGGFGGISPYTDKLSRLKQSR